MEKIRKDAALVALAIKKLGKPITLKPQLNLRFEQVEGFYL